jgi:hypothetical protein
MDLPLLAGEKRQRTGALQGLRRGGRKLFTDFQLFPLISTCFCSFDNKNIFRGASRRLAGGWLE